VNRSLSVKVYQLHNLFDIGRELSAGLDEEAIERLVATTAMGHFLATRSAVYRLGGDGLGLAHVPRLPGGGGGELGSRATPGPSCDLPGPRGVADLAPGPAEGGSHARTLRARGAPRGGGPAERPPRGGGATRRPALRRGGPRLRGRPRSPGPGGARGGAIPPRGPREGAAGPRAGDRARDPAEPASRGRCRGWRASRWRPGPVRASRWAATTTTSSPRPAGGWGSWSPTFRARGRRRA
jgi:hypothetical protein